MFSLVNGLLILLALFSVLAFAGRYDAATLPQPERHQPGERRADMCALLPCKDVFPGRAFFERKGQPPYVEALCDNDSGPEELLGYVMLSTDITDTPAYSRQAGGHAHRHGQDRALCGYQGAQALRTHLLLGIPESALINFNNQYPGQVGQGQKIEVGPSRPEEEVWAWTPSPAPP